VGNEIRYRISRKIKTFVEVCFILGLEVLPFLFGLGFIAVSV
jgi:hypothetical protein